MKAEESQGTIISAEGKTEEPVAGKKEYARVYTGTQMNDWQTALDKHNESKVWNLRVDASEGSVVFTQTKIGGQR